MTAHVERLLYSDRTIVRSHDESTGDGQDGWADLAYEAVRAMNHITSSTGGRGIPAPVAYSILGNLAGMAAMLPQLFDQLESGLRTSLTEYDVYDSKRDPEQSVEEAAALLRSARQAAATMARDLGDAQVAINSQGYNDQD